MEIGTVRIGTLRQTAAATISSLSPILLFLPLARRVSAGRSKESAIPIQ
jgi:hypothetical protein